MRDDILSRSLDCDEVTERLPLYVGDDLDSKDQERVHEHITRCAACQAHSGRATEARQAFLVALDPRGLSAGESLWPGVRARLEAEGLLPGHTAGLAPALPALGSGPERFSASGRPWQARLGWVAAAAAVLLVWLFATSDGLDQGSGSSQPRGFELADGFASAPVDERTELPVLPIFAGNTPLAQGLHLPSLDADKPQGDSIAHGLRRVGSGDERLLDAAELRRMRNRTRPAPSQMLGPGGMNEMAGYR